MNTVTTILFVLSSILITCFVVAWVMKGAGLFCHHVDSNGLTWKAFKEQKYFYSRWFLCQKCGMARYWKNNFSEKETEEKK